MRKICTDLMEDDKEQTTLIFDSNTILGFREIVASGVRSTPLLSSVGTSTIFDNSFPAQGDIPAESFHNYDHKMLCLLQSDSRTNRYIGRYFI